MTNEMSPQEWLAGVAATDDRPAVREVAARTLVRITELETKLAEHERTRTLGGPVDGRRIPDSTGSWDNVAIGGPVQTGYTGATEENS